MCNFFPCHLQTPDTDASVQTPHPCTDKHPSPYQLRSFLPFNLRLASNALPFFVFTLAKNPLLRFCTRLEGLYVFLFAPRKAEAEKRRADVGLRVGVKGLAAIWQKVVGVEGWIESPLKRVVRVEYADRDDGSFCGMVRSLERIREMEVGPINGVYGPVAL